MDERMLIRLGLEGNEARLYKASLKAGRVTPAQLAKITGIKRTTAYSIARSLSEKGLLREDMTVRPRAFIPASAKDVSGLIVDERKRLKEKEKILTQFANELSKVESQKTYPVPQIKFIEEGKIEQFMLNSMDRWHENMLQVDTTWWGFQDHTFVDNFEHVIDVFWQNAPPEIDLKLLSNKSETETRMEGKYPRRKIKFWDKARKFITSTWVVGDFVLMLNTRRHPFYLVEIDDATLAHDQREIFRNLWDTV